MVDELRVVGADNVVHLERVYDVSIDQMWSAWTDPDRLARWLGTPERPMLATRGPVRLVMGDEPDEWVELEVVAADPPHLLELCWDFSETSDTRLRIAMSPLGTTRTLLTLDHYGLGGSATGYGAGWEAYLDGGLRAECGEEPGLPWDERFQQALPMWRERAARLA